tara:strand:+ start:206 stop:601 length:396 start_codon:yes stop_codon:yes gene_type:complete
MLIYNENVFFGLMIVLFILNFTILISTKNMFQSLIYICLIILYGGNTFNIENKINNYIKVNNTYIVGDRTNITDETLYNMKLCIMLSFTFNTILLFVYLGSYLKYKKIHLKKNIQSNINNNSKNELKEPII